MSLLLQMVVPLVMAAVALWGMRKRVDVYGALVRGAEEGLGVMVRIVPAMIALMTAVSMFRASGLPQALGELCSPWLTKLGIPEETIALLLVRPISGNAALSVGSELIAAYGPNSEVGRTAAVMLGSTETTFYTVAVYFGAAGVKRTRHALPAALCADVTAFLVAAWATRAWFGVWSG